MISVEAKCSFETDKAILVEVEGEKVWVPQSIIDDESEVWKQGDEGTLVVPDWFGIKQGWD